MIVTSESICVLIFSELIFFSLYDFFPFFIDNFNQSFFFLLVFVIFKIFCFVKYLRGD